MKLFPDNVKSMLAVFKKKLNIDIILVLVLCIFSMVSFHHTWSLNLEYKSGLTVSAPPVYLSTTDAVILKDLINPQFDDGIAHDIQYVIRNADGTPTADIQVSKGVLIPKNTGTYYLYVYVDGVQSDNAVVIHSYATEAEKEEATAVHETLQENAVLETEPSEYIHYYSSNHNEEHTSNDAYSQIAETAAVNETGRVVFPRSTGASGLSVHYVKDFYNAGPEERSGGVPSDQAFAVLARKGDASPIIMDVFPETDHISAVLGQKDELLPRIWQFAEDGARTLLDPSVIQWESSDPSVIAVDDGIPVLVDEGSAVLTGNTEKGSFTISVDVTNEPEVTDLKIKTDPYTLVFHEDSVAYEADATYWWPTGIPEGTENDVIVKGCRIFRSGSQYYYLNEDIETAWDDLAEGVSGYSDFLIQLSQGLVLMEGDNLSGIVPGVIFRHHDQFWVYTGSDEPNEPFEQDDGWIEISDLFDGADDYDPGADTGPESDALSYPDAKYNPYPGSVSSNCTYAVWALANEALGLRLPNWGDAGNWYRRAGISGYPTGQTPAPYSIIVWDHHVGFVTAVNEDGTMIYIKEGNFNGRYHEGWWPVASSRHGQKLYGYIYLTDNHGTAILPDTVEVTEGFNDTEEAFLKLLEELGLEPGERKEVYSEDVEEGNIVSYTTGELPIGSVIDYTVSLGPKPEIIIDSEVLKKLVGLTREELLEWLEENGLKAGKETVEESEQEDGIVIRAAAGTYKEGDEVDYTVSKKKAAATPEPSDTPQPSETPVAAEEPEASAEPTPSQTPEITPEPEPSQTPESTAEAEPSQTPESTSEPEPTELPSASEEPTAEPEIVPSTDPSGDPTIDPSASADPEPSGQPAEETVIPDTVPDPSPTTETLPEETAGTVPEETPEAAVETPEPSPTAETLPEETAEAVEEAEPVESAEPVSE